MVLTEFGKFSRKLRIDNGELLKDMAKKLGVTSAYLSAVEVGRRKIPEKWLEMIQHLYNITPNEVEIMYNAYEHSINEVKIDLSNQSPTYKETAMMFARELNNFEEDDVKELLEKMRTITSARKENDDKCQ